MNIDMSDFNMLEHLCCTFHKPGPELQHSARVFSLVHLPHLVNAKSNDLVQLQMQPVAEVGERHDNGVC